MYDESFDFRYVFSNYLICFIAISFRAHKTKLHKKPHGKYTKKLSDESTKITKTELFVFWRRTRRCFCTGGEIIVALPSKGLFAAFAHVVWMFASVYAGSRVSAIIIIIMQIIQIRTTRTDDFHGGRGKLSRSRVLFRFCYFKLNLFRRAFDEDPVSRWRGAVEEKGRRRYDGDYIIRILYTHIRSILIAVETRRTWICGFEVLATGRFAGTRFLHGPRGPLQNGAPHPFNFAHENHKRYSSPPPISDHNFSSLGLLFHETRAQWRQN